MHKSDCGGVLLNIKDEKAAADGYEQILINVKAKGPQNAIIKGIEV